MNEIATEKALSDIHLAERLSEAAHQLITHAAREGAIMSPRELLDLARLAYTVQQINMNALGNIRYSARNEQQLPAPDLDEYREALKQALEMF